MTAAAQIEAMRTLYAPGSTELARALPDLADGLSAQLHELLARPTRDRAETLAMNLHGARAHVLRIAEALRAEGRE